MTDLLMANISPNALNHNFNRFLSWNFRNVKRWFFAAFGISVWLWKSVKLDKSTYDPQNYQKTTPYTSCRSHKIEDS